MDKINIDFTEYKTYLTKKFKYRKRYIKEDPNIIKAIIPGIIKKILVKEGSKVKEGDTVLILEAMKMSNHITAEKDGTVKTIFVKENENVKRNQDLIEII